jgi:hypothetical protein
LEQCFLTSKYKEYEGLHLEDVKVIMKYKKDQLEQKKKEEKQHNAVLHAYSKKLAQNAMKETKDATKNMSYYERQRDKRETRKAEARTRGSEDAWTSKDNLNADSKSKQTGEVVQFPGSNSYKGTESDIQKSFSAKNRSRRNRNHEPLE